MIWHNHTITSNYTTIWVEEGTYFFEEVGLELPAKDALSIVTEFKSVKEVPDRAETKK